MKNKIIISIAAGLFTVATFFNLNMAHQGTLGDVSLESLAVMAKADAEQGGGSGLANLCCYIWNVTVEVFWYGTKVTCTTGGKYKCNDCPCPQ